MVALLLSSIEQKESIYGNDQDLICSLQKVRWEQKSTQSWFLGWKGPHCPRDSCRKLSRDMGCLFVCPKCRETISGCRTVGWFGWGGGTSATLLGVALWGTKEELKNNSIAWCLATEGFMRCFPCEPLLYLLPQSLQIITVRGKEKKKSFFEISFSFWIFQSSTFQTSYPFLTAQSMNMELLEGKGAGLSTCFTIM